MSSHDLSRLPISIRGRRDVILVMALLSSGISNSTLATANSFCNIVGFVGNERPNNVSVDLRLPKRTTTSINMAAVSRYRYNINMSISPKRNKSSSSSTMYYKSKSHNDDTAFFAKMKEAEQIERALSDALEDVKHFSSHKKERPESQKLFPPVRQCNAAIATFGDAGDFRRALKLFTTMRRSVSLIRRMSIGGKLFSSAVFIGEDDDHEKEEKEIVGGGNDEEDANRESSWRTPTQSSSQHQHSMTSGSFDLVSFPPKPTLVTYSTLMSRAVSLGKPRVAVRLWNLMKNQPNFYHAVISRKERGKNPDASLYMDTAYLRRLEEEDSAIVPDIIFCNILMNAYAKLGDHVMARLILNSMLGSTCTGNIALHEEIPPITPTVVTYNTLADACKVAGELGAALEVLALMKSHAEKTGDKRLAPDARTYTILISTVARKRKNQSQQDFGEMDPDMAFDLLDRMMAENVNPNGVTYCALIDVCSRCRRVDLALKGLRLMLKQKAGSKVPVQHRRPLFNEVGAWTAAINALGKAGRLDSAMKLFNTMQVFGVKPNAVTCGSLTDSLLKGNRVTETLEVLKYMKGEGLVPGEVMYTSLMGNAINLAERESRNVVTTKDGLQVNVIDKLVTLDGDNDSDVDDTQSKSIVLYTELMRCLIQDYGTKQSEKNIDEDVLLKVFLVYQQMTKLQVQPDLACYNSLLKACAYAGDVERAQQVLKRIQEDGLQPNDTSWREALKAANKACRFDVAESIWDTAVAYRKKGVHDSSPWVPRLSDVETLISTYEKEVKTTSSHQERNELHAKVIRLFEGIQKQSVERGFHHISVESIEKNMNLMLTILRAAVSFAVSPRKGYDSGGIEDDDDRNHARDLACDIAGLEVLQGRLPYSVDRKTKKSLELAREWLYTF